MSDGVRRHCDSRPGKSDFADGEGIQMRQEQFAIAEVEPWRLNRTGDQLGLLLEVVPVVRRVAGAVGEDQGALSASSGSAGTLRIVGGVRWRVAQMNDAQAADIDAQLHGRRAEKRADRLTADPGIVGLLLRFVEVPLGTEPVFALLASIDVELAGVVFRPQSLRLRKVTLVDVAERTHSALGAGLCRLDA